jgi:asparagine synthase (glutamine-hydrolysing)
MCGIFGVFNVDSRRPFDEERFKSSLARIGHRGPDAQHVRRYGQWAMFGHARLSIIDLATESDQPMSLHDRFHVVYNGEIFNYLELRSELQALGATFRTQGDTEVLLQAYAYWGEQCVQRFNGMWAFGILDTVRGTLFCSRDRFGEKPLCWTNRHGQVLFASEAKALLHYDPELAKPDYESIENFCRTSVGAQHVQTWFRDVQRVAPGHNLIVSPSGVRIERYWRYPSGGSQLRDEEEQVRHYRELFDDSVRLRLRSDVPVGVTLSSGLDSTSIACTMQSIAGNRLHCFTAAFDPDAYQRSDFAPYAASVTCIDEASIAERLAHGIGLIPHRVETDYTDFVGSLAQVIRHLESGNSSPAVIPLMQVMRYARQHVKVVLEGQGADELLGGYIVSTILPAVAAELASGRVRSAIDALRSFLEGHSLSYAVKIALRNLSNRLPALSSLQQRVSGIDAVFGPLLRGHLRRRDYPDLRDEGRQDALSSLLMHQHSGGLVNLLHYGDAVSMANAIESRNPFLDHRLVEFAWRLPQRMKVRGGLGKVVHRAAMRGRVPDYILDQKAKFGFTTPIAQQFSESPKSASDHGPVGVLLSQRCLSRGVFDPDGLRSLIKNHREERRDHGNLLFRLLSVELWFREFIDAPTYTQT